MTSIIFWLHLGFMEQVDKNHELEINWIFPKNCWLCVDWNTINWRGEDIDCACAVCHVKQSDVKWLLLCCCCCCCIPSTIYYPTLCYGQYWIEIKIKLELEIQLIPDQGSAPSNAATPSNVFIEFLNIYIDNLGEPRQQLSLWVQLSDFATPPYQ